MDAGGDEFCHHFVDFSFCPAGHVAHGVTSVSPITDSEVVPGERGEMNADEEESSEEEDDDKTSEEARKVHKRRHCDRPPTERERGDHARTHLPYRTWCPACVAGRGRASPYPGSPQDEIVGEMVAYDYCFLRNGPNEACAPTLVAKDRRTKLLMSHVVPCKGADQVWVVAQTLRDLERFGHIGDVVLRSDGKRALVDFDERNCKGQRQQAHCN